jgi:hypothetical protein
MLILKKQSKDAGRIIFITGGHPAMISSGEEFAKVAAEFFRSNG